jgi:hypothetical protein
MACKLACGPFLRPHARAPSRYPKAAAQFPTPHVKPPTEGRRMAVARMFPALSDDRRSMLPPLI